jgi:uncharacterized membrane protein
MGMRKMNILIAGLLWFSALGCGVIAGVYFAFSTFVMTSLGRIDQAGGIAAMKAINTDILKSLFMPLFFATTLACLALGILALMNWGHAGAAAMLAGALFYIVGMFFVTVSFNVPLNETLGTLDPTGPEAAATWKRFLSDWTIWNHVRTVASASATGLFIAALVALNSEPI